MKHLVVLRVNSPCSSCVRCLLIYWWIELWHTCAHTRTFTHPTLSLRWVRLSIFSVCVHVCLWNMFQFVFLSFKTSKIKSTFL
jgi:hypothetical protein